MELKQKVLVVLTLVAAFARRLELNNDLVLTDSEVEERTELNDWWNNQLNYKQRTKIERWMRDQAIGEPGNHEVEAERRLIIVAMYARMLMLRYQLVQGHAESEQSKRLEFEWNVLGTDGQFTVCSWIKEYYRGYKEMGEII